MQHTKIAPAKFIRLLFLIPVSLLLAACASTGGKIRETEYRGIVYSRPEGRSLALDLYVPKSQPAMAAPGQAPNAAEATAPPPPLVIWYHGGGWRFGHRRLYFLTRELTQSGFAVATVSYRLSGRAKWPAQGEDALAALKYLTQNAEQYGVDASRIGLSGNSAGGHLAAYVALTQGRPAVDAVLAMYPPTDLVKLGEPHVAKGDSNLISDLLGGNMGDVQAQARAASPINYVDSGDPPFLFIHGDEDELLPLSESQNLHQRLRAAGVESRVIVEPGRGHGFSLDERLLRETAQFFTRHLKRTESPQ